MKIWRHLGRESKPDLACFSEQMFIFIFLVQVLMTQSLTLLLYTYVHVLQYAKLKNEIENSFWKHKFVSDATDGVQEPFEHNATFRFAYLIIGRQKFKPKSENSCEISNDQFLLKKKFIGRQPGPSFYVLSTTFRL